MLFHADIYELILDGRWGTLVALVKRLPHEERSLARATQLGSTEHFGWGITEYLIAQLTDYLQQNTNVTAAHGSGKAAKKIKPVPRPGSKSSVEYRPKSIREMDTSRIFPI